MKEIKCHIVGLIRDMIFHAKGIARVFLPVLIIFFAGCTSTPLTITFPDGKAITMNQKIASGIDIEYSEIKGEGVVKEEQKYAVSRDNPLKVLPSFNASLINLGAAASAKGD